MTNPAAQAKPKPNQNETKRFVTCHHPDHHPDQDCQDRAVGCAVGCICCMGELAIPMKQAAQELARLSHAKPPSEARKAASAENGKKGGRPKKKQPNQTKPNQTRI
jgi:hypothetical protein